MSLRRIEHGIDLWIRAQFRVLFARRCSGSWFWPARNSTVIWRFRSIQSLNHAKSSNLNSSVSSSCYTICISISSQPISIPFQNVFFHFFSQIEEILWFFVYEKLILPTFWTLYLPGYPEYRPRLTGNKVHSRGKRVPLKRI